MTQTVTAINAIDAAIWLDKAGGTPTDISGSSNSVSIPLTQQLGPFRNFGSRWPKRLEGGKDGAFRLVITYSTAADEALDILRDWFFATEPGARTIKVYVPDKNVGSDVYSAEVRIESLDIPLDSGKAEPITVTANLLPDGAITHATNAT
ncbi:MAG: hypothetical protein EHM56_08015 [Chloroflexi bacterium]|nr:MAG: hypothetical protein EHM56_08015 [Chloroflexota bacterium]